MTPAERKEAWKGLEKVYKPHLDFGEEYPFFGTGSYWQRQNHIYAGPFYYIDYCIAQTSAFQYRIWMEKDYRAAFDSYLKFSRESGSGFYAEMLEENGLEEPLQGGNDPGDRKRNPGTAVKYQDLKKSPRGGREKWRGKNVIWRPWMWRLPTVWPRRWRAIEAIQSLATAGRLPG